MRSFVFKLLVLAALAAAVLWPRLGLFEDIRGAVASLPEGPATMSLPKPDLLGTQSSRFNEMRARGVLALMRDHSPEKKASAPPEEKAAPAKPVPIIKLKPRKGFQGIRPTRIVSGFD